MHTTSCGSEHSNSDKERTIWTRSSVRSGKEPPKDPLKAGTIGLVSTKISLCMGEKGALPPLNTRRAYAISLVASHLQLLVDY